MNDKQAILETIDRLMERLRRQDEAWLGLKNEIVSLYTLLNNMHMDIEKSEIEARFTRVYATNLWLDQESKSGPGSRMDSDPVIQSLSALEEICDAHNISSLVDVPCGDMNWIRSFLEKKPNISYTGLDIVKMIIHKNKEQFPNYNFDVLDVTSNVPPKADLVFSKDLMIHLNDRDIVRAFENIAASGSKFLLASNNFGMQNSDLLEHLHGDSACRYVDVRSYPFETSAPVWHSNFLGLWDLRDFSIKYMA